jgi:hypothetical protein
MLHRVIQSTARIVTQYRRREASARIGSRSSSPGSSRIQRNVAPPSSEGAAMTPPRIAA